MFSGDIEDEDRQQHKTDNEHSYAQNEEFPFCNEMNNAGEASQSSYNIEELKNSLLEKVQDIMQRFSEKHEIDLQHISGLKGVAHSEIEKFFEMLEKNLKDTYDQATTMMEKQKKRLTDSIQRLEKTKQEVEELQAIVDT